MWGLRFDVCNLIFDMWSLRFEILCVCVCVSSSPWTVLATRRHSVHLVFLLILHPRDTLSSSVVTNFETLHIAFQTYWARQADNCSIDDKLRGDWRWKLSFEMRDRIIERWYFICDIWESRFWYLTFDVGYFDIEVLRCWYMSFYLLILPEPPGTRPCIAARVVAARPLTTCAQS